MRKAHAVGQQAVHPVRECLRRRCVANGFRDDLRFQSWHEFAGTARTWPVLFDRLQTSRFVAADSELHCVSGHPYGIRQAAAGFTLAVPKRVFARSIWRRGSVRDPSHVARTLGSPPRNTSFFGALPMTGPRAGRRVDWLDTPRLEEPQ